MAVVKAESQHGNRRFRSQRWVFDLRACQTAASANRGVGHYSRSLFDGVRAVNAGVDFYAVASDALPYPVAPAGLANARIVRVPPPPDNLGFRKAQGGLRDELEAVLLSHRLAPLKADLVHLSHVFEGFDDGVALPSFDCKPPGQVLSATLYDLIPLLFKEHYFQDAAFARWYQSRIGWLRCADLLLAISESSRKDAIELLGIDPTRIVTVHGGIGPSFVASEDREALGRDLRRRYALRGRFVLYTGGDDHRKNIAGGIRAYAKLPGPLRLGCQLVVVCSMQEQRKAMYAEIGRKAGLGDNELVVTGFVPEADLVAFYQCCDAFFFPSLYEGLGLPVLEAMACGAPTIGGDNSSIRELVGRSDALFDAGSSASAAAVLNRVLADRAFADNLRRHGLERAKTFTWQRSAELASAAMVEAVSRVQAAGVQAASHGWVAKKRLAVLTPLPPCRSGIADYNSRFLPFLARHFQIDLVVDNYEVEDVGLTSAFRVLRVSQFENTAHLYDAILYEFGNSEFHRYMLPLLDRFPGVVGLHDAYLSGLYEYTGAVSGNGQYFPGHMIEAHGPRARRYFAPAMEHTNPHGSAVVELPCTKPVLDRALGVISHSPFNLDLAKRNYPEGWQAPYRIIPQMVQIPKAGIDKAAIRRELGVPPSAVLVVTLGHVVWTKWGDRLLEAFLLSTLRSNPDAHLVYVGELLRDAFGLQLADRIAAANLDDRIRVTGFVDEARFERFLGAADVAVQLRTKSRGGTPKGVLDCLAHGVPVIVNEGASYSDYPDDVVFKLPADPTVLQIAGALDALCNSAEQRQRLASRGWRHVREHHDPEACARMYAAAIHEFVAREACAQDAKATDALAPLLAQCSAPEQAAQAVAQVMLGRRTSYFRRRQIYVDVSCTSLVDLETGIQRVVKKIVHHLYTLDEAGFDAVAVELSGGRLHVASKWLKAKGLLHPGELDSRQPERQVVFAAGDVLLMLDSSWARYSEFEPVFAQARAAGATVMTAVYDLLPLQLPDGFIVDGGPAWFRNWVLKAVDASNALIAISHAVAVDVQKFIQQVPDLARRPRVGYWHLGSDIADGSSNVQSGKVQGLAEWRPYLLMVGTLEPRKSHDLVISAMEHLWANGSELSLCIAGKEGWLVDDLMKRLRGHPQLHRKLHFVEHPSDGDISQLYEYAAGLLFLSKGEGFGLPLVEAANHGTPILCSDLPVFREICGDFAFYLSAWKASEVAAEIASWWEARQRGRLPDTSKMPRLTWEQSAKALLDVIVQEAWLPTVSRAYVSAPPVRPGQRDAALKFDNVVGRKNYDFGTLVVELQGTESGYALFGPFVSLAKGSYRAEFNVYADQQQAAADCSLTFDVISADGTLVHCAHRLGINELDAVQGWRQISVEFDLAATTHRIEARCRVDQFFGSVLGHVEFVARRS